MQQPDSPVFAMSDRQIETDVLVIGGGTAGFGAAVAAGRQGLRVTLLEATTKIGGVMAFCPGMPWGGGYPVDRIIGGLIEELTERLMAMDPPAAEKRPCTLENFGPEIIYDHDIATLTMVEMLEEAGVQTRLGATALEPEMDGNRIASVSCCDRNGPFIIRPGVVIDCSGDGDISAKAGVPYALGDENRLQQIFHNLLGNSIKFTEAGGIEIYAAVKGEFLEVKVVRRPAFWFTWKYPAPSLFPVLKSSVFGTPISTAASRTASKISQLMRGGSTRQSPPTP